MTISHAFDASAANFQNEPLFNIYTESEREEEQGVCSAIPTLYGDSRRSLSLYRDRLKGGRQVW